MQRVAASLDVYDNAIHIQLHLNSRFTSKHGHSLGVAPSKSLCPTTKGNEIVAKSEINKEQVVTKQSLSNHQVIVKL